MKLYNFFNSSTSYRLRIALNLKGLTYDYTAIDLRIDENLTPEFKAVNPQGFVPAAIVGGRLMIQSPAMIEWLEETYPEPPLLPADPADRAHVRALAAIVGCDVHPINNRRILQYLRKQFGRDEAAIVQWCAHWIEAGFDTLEALLAADPRRGAFCFGDTPTVADIYLVPQVQSARRFKVDVARWPLIKAIDEACAKVDAFRLAAPAVQPDAD